MITKSPKWSSCITIWFRRIPNMDFTNQNTGLEGNWLGELVFEAQTRRHKKSSFWEKTGFWIFETIGSYATRFCVVIA